MFFSCHMPMKIFFCLVSWAHNIEMCVTRAWLLDYALTHLACGGIIKCIVKEMFAKRHERGYGPTVKFYLVLLLLRHTASPTLRRVVCPASSLPQLRTRKQNRRVGYLLEMVFICLRKTFVNYVARRNTLS